jgi:transglutaminase-like putative cysteine protease
VSALPADRSRQIELACFAALACVAALRWVALVAEPPSGRMALAVLLATAAGAALVAIGGLRVSRGVRWLLGGTVATCALAIGLVLVGLPARLLLPGNWGELGSNVDASLNGVADVRVPYAGADDWTRLVIVLFAPLVVGFAAVAAFWPKRRRLAGRIAALTLLAGLYFIAVAWDRPDGQLAGGVVLLVLVCAWLWLPGLERGRRRGAAVAVALALAVALPATALIEPSKSVIDYRHWKLFGADALGFRWEQSYGPLDWPQRGTLLLEVASERSHYWKATNLDRFDGVRWVRSDSGAPEPEFGLLRRVNSETLQQDRGPDWVDRINFRNRRLTGDIAVGAGTVLDLDRIEASPTPDRVWEMHEELDPGDTYTALVYDPKPSPEEMRAAGTAYPLEAQRYTAFYLPGRPAPLVPEFWTLAGARPPLDRLQGTPYERMDGLARRITGGAPTPYDAITRIERYLRGAYGYRQDVPEHDYPLPAFLAEDQAGYCQQFSGTMALMLRMLGIPSRVAAGFSAGTRASNGDGFLVEDTDAHNWVEAFLPGIGWVTFEPTPAAAPADAQLNDETPGALGLSLASGQSTSSDLSDPRDLNAPQPEPQAAGRGAAGDGGGSTALVIIGIVAAALALAPTLLYGGRRARTSRLDSGELAEAEMRELEGALARLGHRLPPGATLLGAERRLAALAGPRAATYAAALRERRYRDPDEPPPGMPERRSLRSALLRARASARGGIGGIRWVLRVLRAIPPGGPANRRKGRRQRSRSAAAPSRTDVGVTSPLSGIS